MAYRIISGDSHFVEPPTMWQDRIDKEFRDRAPHTVKNYVRGEMTPSYIALPNKPAVTPASRSGK